MSGHMLPIDRPCSSECFLTAAQESKRSSHHHLEKPPRLPQRSSSPPRPRYLLMTASLAGARPVAVTSLHWAAPISTPVLVSVSAGRGPFLFGDDGAPGRSGTAGRLASPCGLDHGRTPGTRRLTSIASSAPGPGRERGGEAGCTAVACGGARSPAAGWASQYFPVACRGIWGQTGQTSPTPLGTAAPACGRLENRQSKSVRKAGGEERKGRRGGKGAGSPHAARLPMTKGREGGTRAAQPGPFKVEGDLLGGDPAEPLSPKTSSRIIGRERCEKPSPAESSSLPLPSGSSPPTPPPSSHLPSLNVT
ncbi:collagen alpha-1(I) chain-like [Chiroxiphia lanceolata]|uniref:collagen alpha-1(I) chain-like n=1 Tax=Chiroxiphia lanceolata TaxID=296741 RepID=UPI0013CE5788|nr:collagen alpha-1(I) chain-like [Chiroxiphia lanceolata]